MRVVAIIQKGLFGPLCKMNDAVVRVGL